MAANRSPRTRQVPITGARPKYGPTPNVLTNAADTSRDAQRIVSQPPSPFQNPYGTVNAPAPANRNAEHPYGLPAKSLSPASAGAQNKSNLMSDDEMMKIAGYEPTATKSSNPIISGYATGRRGKR